MAPALRWAAAHLHTSLHTSLQRRTPYFLLPTSYAVPIPLSRGVRTRALRPHPRPAFLARRAASASELDPRSLRISWRGRRRRGRRRRGRRRVHRNACRRLVLLLLGRSRRRSRRPPSAPSDGLRLRLRFRQLELELLSSVSGTTPAHGRALDPGPRPWPSTLALDPSLDSTPLDSTRLHSTALDSALSTCPIRMGPPYAKLDPGPGPWPSVCQATAGLGKG